MGADLVLEDHRKKPMLATSSIVRRVRAWTRTRQEMLRVLHPGHDRQEDDSWYTASGEAQEASLGYWDGV